MLDKLPGRRIEMWIYVWYYSNAFTQWCVNGGLCGQNEECGGSENEKWF